MRALALAAALLAGAAAADPAEDAAPLDACLGRFLPDDPAGAAVECVGMVEKPCLQSRDDYSTAATNACVSAEADAWDALLNRDWPRLRERARRIDEANAGFPAAATAAGTLLAAQRAWLAFRDEECSSVAAEYGAGTFASTAHAGCRLDMTARRVIDLRTRLLTQ